MALAHVSGRLDPARRYTFAADIRSQAVSTLAKLVVLEAAASVLSLVLQAHDVDFG